MFVLGIPELLILLGIGLLIWIWYVSRKPKKTSEQENQAQTSTEDLSRKQAVEWIGWGLALLLVVLFFTWPYIGNFIGRGGAIAIIEDKSWKPWLFGLTDYGYKIKVTVRNMGLDGYIEVKATVRGDQGSWTKKKRLFMPAGTVETVEFDFPEPSFWDTSFSYTVSAR